MFSLYFFLFLLQVHLLETGFEYLYSILVNVISNTSFFFLTVRFALFLFYAIHAVLLDAPAKKYACLVFACTPNVFMCINAKRGENEVKQEKKTQ